MTFEEISGITADPRKFLVSHAAELVYVFDFIFFSDGVHVPVVAVKKHITFASPVSPKAVE